jgi:hypothetical protein
MCQNAPLTAHNRGAKLLFLRAERRFQLWNTFYPNFPISTLSFAQNHTAAPLRQRPRFFSAQPKAAA